MTMSKVRSRAIAFSLMAISAVCAAVITKQCCEPRTHAFAHHRELWKKLYFGFGGGGGSWSRADRSWDDASLPRSYAIREMFSATLFPGEGWFDVAVIGDPRYTLLACGVHIGPGPLHHPLHLDFIRRLFDDPELAERVMDAIGPIYVESEYDVMVNVEGINVHLQQFDGVSGPTVEFAVDGCGRVSSTQSLREHGKRLEFSMTSPDGSNSRN
jgi:hypothetical protein